VRVTEQQIIQYIAQKLDQHDTTVCDQFEGFIQEHNREIWAARERQQAGQGERVAATSKSKFPALARLLSKREKDQENDAVDDDDPLDDPDRDDACSECGGSGEDESGNQCERCSGSGVEPSADDEDDEDPDQRRRDEDDSEDDE
jgi:hypothetical protein